ncbi:MAG TPA: retropepsin-like aspartic protease [Xanthomonadaceae bacterium]|nr:retropepsin-like aspartic protease [Xanthomonadaceae bacterium]
MNLTPFFLVLTLLASQAAPAADGGPVATASIPLRIDRFDYYKAEVMLDGKGPFRFMVDTGSAYSVLSTLTAALMRLRPDGSVSVQSADGNPANGVLVEDYRSDLFDLHDEPMIVFPIYAQGVMGMRAFVGGRIELDFFRKRMAFGPSGPAPAGYMTVKGTLGGTTSLIVDVIVDGVRAKALIDTGARYTIGNPALQAAMGFAPDDKRLRREDPISDMSVRPTPAWKTRLGQLAIGDAVFPAPEVRFADMRAFGRLGLNDGPALILGIDQLSRLKAMAIDYPRVELQLLQIQR